MASLLSNGRAFAPAARQPLTRANMRAFKWEKKNMSPDTNLAIRQARGGGTWFPADRGTLERMVDGFIEAADVTMEAGSRIVSAIAPHAGYQYSGAVAGYTFRALRDRAAGGPSPETVVILGFPHRCAFAGVALMDGEALETPLGRAELDSDAGSLMMRGRSRIVRDYAPHAGEHSAENQVPFVQRALPRAKLVIALVGAHDRATQRDLLEALLGLARRKTIVVVASSDMLHDPDYALVSQTDRDTLRKVAALDHAAVLRDWRLDRQTFCGIVPVLTAMQLAQQLGGRKGTVLHYRNSGDDYPESRGQWVVGYGAVVFTA